jgi:hypothetical protein
MEQKTTTQSSASSQMWERLEEFVREQVQRFIQALLEEEVSALLGRPKSARRAPVDGPSGLRNGDGKPRRLSLTAGTITVRRPRVRGLSQRFVSRVLPLLKRRTREVGDLLPTLYVHGLALGDFDLALRGLLGDAAPVSPASLARLKATWQLDYEAWKQRRLDDLEVVDVWADGLYVKAGLEATKAALLVGYRRPDYRAKSRARRGERTAGIEGIVGGRAPGSPRAGAEALALDDCRRPPRPLGRSRCTATGRRRAAVLEPSDHQRARCHAEKTPG